MLKPINFRLDGTVNQDPQPSPSVWDGCPVLAIKEGKIRGYWQEDEFTKWALTATQTTQVQQGDYKIYNTGSGEVINDDMPHTTTPAGPGGIVSMLCDTDGDASVFGTVGCPFLLSTTTNTKLCFEARVATTSILTAMGQWFVGLCENFVVTFGAATPLANSDATASTCAMIGFNRLEDGLNVLNTSYADHAATWTDVQASANTTLAANTWIKLGMVFDPKNSSRCVRFFVDGVECSSALTKATLLATTHLDAKGLGFCMAFFADASGTSDYTYCDWFRCYQWVPEG